MYWWGFLSYDDFKMSTKSIELTKWKNRKRLSIILQNLMFPSRNSIQELIIWINYPNEKSERDIKSSQQE